MSKATLNRLLNDFYPYAKEYLGFDKDADVYFVSDMDNANKPLGKTAHYDPAKREISVYTDNRHTKDIMRSVSHELVHHAQNCRGDLGMSEDTGQGYAQNDEHLREMEREAYEKGNLCFRDWEDGIKSNLQPGTIYESRARRSKKSMNNMKSITESFKNYLQKENEADNYEAGDKVKDLRKDTVGTVVEPMAGGAIIELEDGTIVKTRDKFLEKVDGDPMQEASGEPKQGDDVVVMAGGLAGAAGEVMELTTSTQGEPAVVIYLRKDADKRVMGAAGDEVIALVSDVQVDSGIQGDGAIDRGAMEEPEDDSNWVGHSAHYQESTDVTEEYNGHLWENKIDKIVNAVLNEMSGDPVGPVEAQKVAELLQSLGFTLTRGGRNGLEDFLLSLEQSGDLNATPDTRRGAIAEYGDHETQAQGGMVSSSHSSDPEFDQIVDIVRTVVEQGGGLHDFKQALQAESFGVQTTSSVVLVDSNGTVAIASADNVDLDGDEEIIKSPDGSSYAVGRINQGQMEEGFRGSPEEKEMTSKMSNKEFSDYHTRDKHLTPDLKGDMGAIDGMEGPFQYASGAVLYYDPKAGKYYDRGKDMYLDNEEASRITMNEGLNEGDFVGHHAEIDGKTYVDSNFLNSVRKIRDTFPHSLESMGFGEFYLNTPEGRIDFNRMRGQEFPGMVGRSHQLHSDPPELADRLIDAMEQAGASETPLPVEEPPPGAEEAAQLTMENKNMKLREKVLASVMAALKEGNFAEYGAIDAEDGNPPSKIGQGDEAYMAAYNAVLVARGEEPLPVVQPDQAYLDALQSGSMKPEDHSYNKKGMQEMYDDDDPYADDDPYMASLEAEFPWLADKKKGAAPATPEDEAAAAAAAADAAAAGEFKMARGEEDEEEPTVMKEEEWSPPRSRDDVKYGGQIHLIPDVQFTRNIEADIQDLPPEILNWLYGELSSADAIEDEYGTNYAGADVQDIVAALPDELFERNKNNNGETKTMRLKTNIFEDENAFTETLRGRVMKRLQELSKGQEEMDLDDDGKIEPEDLAGLRAGKEDEDVGEEAEEKKEESLRDRVGRIVQETLGGGDDPEAKMQAVIQDILAASPEGVETNDLIDAIQRAHPEISVPEIIDFMQSGAMDISSDEATGNWHLEEGKYKKEAEGDDPEADEEDKEKQEEQIATNPQDFFRKLRNESRTVVKEDWTKSSKSKRSAMLNERLMKSWFNK